MTDRELLKDAAKAAGIEYDKQRSEPHPKSSAFWGLWLIIRHEPTDFTRRYWNPLTDDGDALRLVVKLGLQVFQTKYYVRCGRKTLEMPIEESKRDQDHYAATRRAIVRAAAEIGKGMK